jgi:hypothetical protein
MTSEVRSSGLEIKDKEKDKDVESAKHPYEVRRVLQSIVMESGRPDNRL